VDRVAAELRGPVRRIPVLPLGFRPVRRLVRAAVTRLPTPATPGVRIEPVAVGRVLRPTQPRSTAALLWVHGGGYLIGAPNQDDARCAAVCRELGVVVLSVAYRLAPEHVFPAALTDCRAGWTWLIEHAAGLGVDPARIVLGGESAGGGLAAGLAQQLHDDAATPLGQWLWYPMLDDRTAAGRDDQRRRVWTNRLNRIGWRAYLGREPGAAAVPPYAVAARRDDLTGLPPAWIGVGDVDLFHAEDLRYAAGLRAVGVPVTLDVVAGAPHGFASWAPTTRISTGFTARATDWLGDLIGSVGAG
jgi:acetyl esterase/lipase